MTELNLSIIFFYYFFQNSNLSQSLWMLSINFELLHSWCTKVTLKWGEKGCIGKRGAQEISAKGVHRGYPKKVISKIEIVNLMIGLRVILMRIEKKIRSPHILNPTFGYLGIFWDQKNCPNLERRGTHVALQDIARYSIGFRQLLLEAVAQENA